MVDVYVDSAVKDVRHLYDSIITMDLSNTSILQFLRLQSETLVQAHAKQDKTVIFQLSCWCHDFRGKPPNEIMTHVLTTDMANQTIASEYGYDNWSEVESLSGTMHHLEFETCVDHMLNGEIDQLTLALANNPALAIQQSQYGHQSTLLHYLAANGVETHRQVTPANASQLAQCLIDHGTDVNAQANMYGGSKALGLLLTSAHPKNAGVVDEVAMVLRLAGAVES